MAITKEFYEYSRAQNIVHLVLYLSFFAVNLAFKMKCFRNNRLALHKGPRRTIIILIICPFLLSLWSIVDILFAYKVIITDGQQKKLMILLKNLVPVVILSVADCVYFLFGFLLKNLEIQMSAINSDESPKLIIRRIVRNHRMAKMIVMAYFTQTILFSIELYIARFVQMRELGNKLWMCYIIWYVAIVSPFRIFIFVSFWRMGYSYKEYHKKLKTRRGIGFVSFVQAFSIFSTVWSAFNKIVNLLYNKEISKMKEDPMYQWTLESNMRSVE